uniref:ATM serine/threonine kinase n=1 Tax=Sus scrofa TaxID=9823 RepID=A0A8D0WNM6_PIG
HWQTVRRRVPFRARCFGRVFGVRRAWADRTRTLRTSTASARDARCVATLSLVGSGISAWTGGSGCCWEWSGDLVCGYAATRDSTWLSSPAVLKAVENFRHLIQDPETVQHLDQHSDSKQGKYLNWDAAFRFLQKYIQKETECLRTAKQNVSASTQATRQKKMQEISSLVKYFIKCANKRAPRLKCQELLNYIMDTVRDSSNNPIYGADYSNILLKDILSVRKYWCEISQQQWRDWLEPQDDSFF